MHDTDGLTCTRLGDGPQRESLRRTSDAGASRLVGARLRRRGRRRGSAGGRTGNSSVEGDGQRGLGE